MNRPIPCAAVLIIVLAVSLLQPPSPWAAQAHRSPGPAPPSPMNVATDILVMRPVGLVMIPVLGLVYLIGYPFAASSGSVPDTRQALIGDTIAFTFKRPLGRGAPFE